METVERWWNGRHGSVPDGELRRDARLLRDGELWRVEICLGGRGGEYDTSDPGNEAYARRLLARVLETGGEGWRRVD